MRAAAERLGVNHSTVLRRIAQLEERLGVHMFEKLPSGYRLTAAGEEVLEFADQMEASCRTCWRRGSSGARSERARAVAGDAGAAPSRHTCSCPDFADFARLHPDIEMEILSSGELADQSAERPMSRSASSPTAKPCRSRLHGLKGPELFGGVYISRDRLAAWRAGAPDPIRWIVISLPGIPDWAHEGEVRTTGDPFRITDAETQIVAVRQGSG